MSRTNCVSAELCLANQVGKREPNQLGGPLFSFLKYAALFTIVFTTFHSGFVSSHQNRCEAFQKNAPNQSNIQALFFTQSGCQPCHSMQPTINHLIRNDFPIRPVDVPSNLSLAQRFRITSTPTVVVIRDGIEVERKSGVLTAHAITGMLMRAGFKANQDVLTKPNLATSVTNWMDRSNANKQKKLNHLSPTESVANRDFSLAEKKAFAASVRIKVQYRSGNSIITDYGTGTVIHRHKNDILILTCGHIFRESKGHADLVLELGFQGGKPGQIVRGQLLRYDSQAADVALIAATTTLPVQPVEIETGQFSPTQGEKVFSLGCDHGNPLSVRRGRYLNSAKIGPAVTEKLARPESMVLKYDVTGRPATGRSGGGLFSANGKLIGVCNAAMVNADKGVYSAIENVHQLLHQSNLASLFSNPRNNSFGGHQMIAQSGRFRPVIEKRSFGSLPPDGVSDGRSRIASAASVSSNQNAFSSRQTVVRGQSN